MYRSDFNGFRNQMNDESGRLKIENKKIHTIFLLMNAPQAMQNIDREPLFCNQFAKPHV